MRVTLLRHGQTAGNLLGQYVGSSNLPLCEAGRQLAEGIGACRGAKKVYTSNLARAVQTAEILYPCAEIIRDEGLDEMDFGRFEQKSWRDLEQDGEYRAWVDSGCEAACPGGEDKASFTQRCVDAFFKGACGRGGAGCGGTALCCTWRYHHGRYERACRPGAALF